MSTTSIDQILQVALPRSTAADASRTESADGARFQDHLQRASTSEDDSTESTTSPPDNETEDVAIGTGQEREDTQEQSQIDASAVEGEESNSPPVEETEAIDNSDDILISDAADVVAATIEVPLTNEVTPELVAQIHDTGELPEEHQKSRNYSLNNLQPATTENQGEPTTLESEQQPTSATEISQTAIPVVTEQTYQEFSTDTSTAEVINADSPQEVKLPQQNTSGNSSGQDGSELPYQPLHDSSTSEQTVLETEIEPSASKTETNSKEENTKSHQINRSVIDTTLDQELVKTSTEVEATPIVPAASEASANLQNETVLSTDRSAGTSYIESSPSTETAQPSDSTPTIDRARFIQRVSGAIRAAKDQDGLVQLKLSPPELGTLRIEITVKQGALTAQLETETAAARNVLLDNLPALRDRLAEQEIRIEKFDVDVRQEGQSQQENSGAEDRQSTRPETDTRSGRANDTTNEQERTLSGPEMIQQHTDLTDGLDVMI